jgi:hypothetical protein
MCCPVEPVPGKHRSHPPVSFDYLDQGPLVLGAVRGRLDNGSHHRGERHADGVFAPMPLVGFVDLNLDCKVQRLAMANPHTSVKAPQARRAEQNEQRARRAGLDRG